jgi:gamma-glutamylcyclotransferase (GGCT)/AIG2-like uncharacterized protein YtfP
MRDDLILRQAQDEVMRFFFYGTLRDADVRRAILGPSVDRVSITAARLPGYKCVFMRGRVYPVLRRDPCGAVEGVIADGVDAAQASRIDRFETNEYRARPARILAASGETVAATVYFAARPGLATTMPWRFSEWQRRHKRGALRGWFRI